MDHSTSPTSTMQARTQSFEQGHRHSPLSRTALATRSLVAADRLRSQGREDEYRAAMAQHFAEFGSGQVCSMQRW